MMTEWEAVEKRVSCRAYKEELIDAETRGKLAKLLAELSEESGLRLELVSRENMEKPAVKLAGAMFDGNVYTYAAFIGGEDTLSAEKIGYYGEKFVLYATQLGLGTCWVAGTYDRDSVELTLAKGEKLWDVVPLGWPKEKTPFKQNLIRTGLRKRDRKLEQFVEGTPYEQTPDWFKKAIEAVRLGPSAVNQQPVNFVYQGGKGQPDGAEKITAHLRKEGNSLAYNDLGIAKYQFEVGAAVCGVNGRWDFGGNAEFHKI